MSEHEHEEALPDARIMITVSTKGTHDLETGVRELNPILQEVLKARLSPPGEDRARPMPFGRLRFSQHK